MAQNLHPCCNPSSTCPIWIGNPTGKIITSNDIEIYISKPEMRKSSVDSKSSTEIQEPENRVILFLTDALGIHHPNPRLLADSFATHLSCDVVMPDQLAGHARPLINTDTSPAQFKEWKAAHEPQATDPILERVLAYIHTTYGSDVKIGGVGYCFGGRYVIRLMGSGAIDVGVINHPSFFTMEEVSQLGEGKRLAMYAAEIDDILTPEIRRETEDVLGKTGTSWMSTLFSGTEHGFTVRGDLGVKEVRLAKEKAFRGAVEWFEDWL
jgi:dienelactone hydrolase